MDQKPSATSNGRPLKFYQELSGNLTLLAQKLGWLHATLDSKKDEKETRSATLPEDSLARELPLCDALVVNCFTDLGLCMNTGMGVSSFPWAEVRAYSLQSGKLLTGWESQQLVNMSREYCLWLNKAKDPALESPWHCEEYSYQVALEENRQRVIDGMMKQRAERLAMNKKAP